MGGLVEGSESRVGRLAVKESAAPQDPPLFTTALFSRCSWNVRPFWRTPARLVYLSWWSVLKKYLSNISPDPYTLIGFLLHSFFLIDQRYINGSGHGSEREAKTGGKTPEDAAGNDEFSPQPKVLRLRPARPDLRQHDRGLVRLHVLLRHPVSHPPVCLSVWASLFHTLCLKT